jgi:uncharacterized repeat protein (TIGR02543 family)
LCGGLDVKKTRFYNGRRFIVSIITSLLISALLFTGIGYAENSYDGENNDTITITLNADGGRVSPHKMVVIKGGASVSLPMPKKSGWKFGGWYDEVFYERVHSPVSYDDIDEYFDDEDAFPLVACWKKTITVKFNGNKGKAKKKGKKIAYTNLYEVEYGSLPKASRKGYIFKGWYTKKSGGKRVTAASEVVNEKNHSIYAHWKKIPKSYISKSEYKKIKKGMTYKQVCKVIGGRGYSRFYDWYEGEYYWDKVVSVYIGSEFRIFNVYWDSAKTYNKDKWACQVIFNHGRVIDKVNYGI